MILAWLEVYADSVLIGFFILFVTFYILKPAEKIQ